MKQQLHEFLSFKYGRLLFLAMMIFIGQGVVFSQGITVTTNADNGAGSLRQAIADAVDGDVIDFDGAITTITLDSALNLGDKTLTINGGGDVVLHREELALDSFRLVTITGVMDKVVTIKDLTIENGYSKGEDGGGLIADHSAGGITTLDGIIFKNNKATGSGGAALVTGYNPDTASVVTNCQFLGNEVFGGSNGDGDGGGIKADAAIISGCTFMDNVAADDGGALWIVEVYVSDCHIEGSIGGDAGGAVRIQNVAGTFENCTFVGNSSEGQGGAIFMARGTLINCNFINNIAAGQGGAVSANQNECIIDGCVFTGNRTFTKGGGAYVDDGGSVTNSVFSGNTAGENGGGAFLAGKNAPALSAGCIYSYNTTDSTGGGLHVWKANVINSVLTNNYAGVNGGALAGDGNWQIANSIIFGNDAAGDDKSIHKIANAGASDATNTAIDGTPAWTATDITVLTESPFVGGTEADSLMVPYSSPLIDIGSTDAAITDLLPATDLNGTNRIINSVVDLGAYERLQSFIVTTDADAGAGSLRQIAADAVDGESIITFADGITTILLDTPLDLGDKTLIIDGGGDIVLDGAFNADPLLDINRVITITGVAGKEVTIQNLTIQNGNASDGNGGGIIADHAAGGKTVLENVVFDNNAAFRYAGGLYLIGSVDSPSSVTNCTFTNNSVNNGSGEGDGGGMYGEYTMVSECTFTDNVATDDAGALYAQVGMEITNTTFTGNAGGDAGGAIRTGNVENVISGCTFDSNSAATGAGGAIFLARGKIYDSEFVNNSAGSTGGAISANNDECYIENTMFSGNSAGTIGGAVYFDDGGLFSNCVAKNNTAGTDGGALYLKGAKGNPAKVVGSVIYGNTATGQGGGVYTLVGDVINSIITKNSAGTNGGALTGNGTWFLANSVVWENDAAGTDKNIEVLTNAADPAAVNSAVDATAYNAAAWTALNITTLDASPFVGGTGADSLYFPENSPLVDAGTLDYGIAGLLPAMDLDGNDRIQGTIDMGVYETEVIGVIGVTLEPTLIQVSVGGTATLVATIEPANAGDKSVTWSSSDDAVATVADGVVTGVSAGTVTITVTTNNGGFTATAEVTVIVSVTGITLDQSAVTLDAGATVTLVATIEPANATDQTILWASGNEDVATVDANGLVTAIAPGIATITAITKDGSFIALCEITVNEPTVAVTGVSLDQQTLELEAGGTATLVATVEPGDATDPSVSWASSDEAVATVADGVVTAVADGTCTITVTTTDGGFEATCAVTVETVGVSLSEVGLKLYPNPVQNRLMIEGKEIQSATIYSVTGTALLIVERGFAEGIDVSAIESGMYLLKITTGNGTAVTTIIKE